jgi:phosphoserine phosphatase
MNLVIQHPALADATVAAIAAELDARLEARAGQSARLALPAAIDRVRADALASAHGVDLAPAMPGLRLADHRLIAFDMDSTLINIECVDEIADYAGRKAEVAAITEAAMRGEIADYVESLRRRVTLLAGVPESALIDIYERRLRVTPGAGTLISTARSLGLRVLLVSGGFTFFTDRLATRLGIDHVRANRLVIRNGVLTGELDGEIVDARLKRETVADLCATLGCSPRQAIVVGDGANDLQMMAIAGLSVAYRAKPVVRAQTSWALNHCGLDAILNGFEDTFGAPVSAPA